MLFGGIKMLEEEYERGDGGYSSVALNSIPRTARVTITHHILAPSLQFKHAQVALLDDESILQQG